MIGEPSSHWAVNRLWTSQILRMRRSKVMLTTSNSLLTVARHQGNAINMTFCELTRDPILPNQNTAMLKVDAIAM